jgi:hypothetical protein
VLVEVDPFPQARLKAESKRIDAIKYGEEPN